MCLIALAWRMHPRYRLVVAANRDEFHARPTAAAQWWAHPQGGAAPVEWLGGRDLGAGGTWLGVTRSARFAAVTNFRSGRKPESQAASRGHLVTQFLASVSPLESALTAVATTGAQCNPYSILCADSAGLGIHEHSAGSARRLPPGVYALSNNLLDFPWPKVQWAKTRLEQALPALPRTDALLELLRDEQRAPDELLPDTGVGLERERMLSSIFIRGETYGTRSSTVVLLEENGEAELHEWRWGSGASPAGELHFRFMQQQDQAR